MSRRLASSAVAIGVAVGFGAAPTRADTNLTSSFSWVELEGAESCGGGPAVAAAVEQRVGRHALVSPAQADRSIEGYVERSGRPLRWHAVVVLRGRDGGVLGTREFSSAASDCNELRASVVLAAALMIDPDAALRAHPPPPASSSAVAAEVPAPVNSEEAPAPAPSSSAAPTRQHADESGSPAPTRQHADESGSPAPTRQHADESGSPGPALDDPPAPAAHESPHPPPSGPSPRWHVAPTAAFALGFGTLPSVAPGFRGTLLVSPPSFWPIEVYAGVWADQSAVAQGPARVRLSMPFAGMDLCPLHLGKPVSVRFLVCAGAEVAFLSSHADGFTNGQASMNPSLSAVVPARLMVPIVGGLGLTLGGQLGVALIRDQFLYWDSMGTRQKVTEPSLLAGTGEAGLSVSLP